MKHDMCSGDEDKDIKFEFFISQKSGKHKNIGSVILNIADLKSNLNRNIFPKHLQFLENRLKINNKKNLLHTNKNLYAFKYVSILFF